MQRGATAGLAMAAVCLVAFATSASAHADAPPRVPADAGTGLTHGTPSPSPSPSLRLHRRRGTWGVGIFDDDTALDVRDAFRELIAADVSPSDATERILDEYEIAEPVGPRAGVAWLGLAVTQWRLGRVVEHVRDTALRAIDQELARPLFRGADRRRREAVLVRTRERLTSPPPAPRPLRARPVAQSPFRPGDVLQYTMTSGRQVALWAMFDDRHQGLTSVSVTTAFRVHAIGDPELPPLAELVRQPSLVTATGSGYRSVHQLYLHLPQEAIGPAWEVIANVPFPSPDEARLGPFTVFEVERGRLPRASERVLERWFERSRMRHS